MKHILLLSMATLAIISGILAVLGKAKQTQAHGWKITATSTVDLLTNLVTFDTPQRDDRVGTCYRFRDADGKGFTYLSTQNGVPTWSVSTCE